MSDVRFESIAMYIYRCLLSEKTHAEKQAMDLPANVTKDKLIQHEQSKHERINYGCYQCDYKATAQHCLKQHQQSMHEGIIMVVTTKPLCGVV